MATERTAPLIALVGADGSGKTTVGQALLAWLRERHPEAELHHLGKQTGAIGRSIARLPLVGGRLDRGISRRAGGAKEAGGGPGPVTALVIYAFSMRRVRRFRRMLRARARGAAILTDRFPQLGTPGPMDGLGLARAHGARPLVAWLARRERAHYEAMALHRPDLVIRLKVDLPTALARKPDHRPSSLAAKVADVERLSFEGTPIVDIDATRPLPEVLDRAKRAIADVIEQR